MDFNLPVIWAFPPLPEEGQKPQKAVLGKKKEAVKNELGSLKQTSILVTKKGEGAHCIQLVTLVLVYHYLFFLGPPLESFFLSFYFHRWPFDPDTFSLPPCKNLLNTYCVPW